METLLVSCQAYKQLCFYNILQVPPFIVPSGYLSFDFSSPPPIIGTPFYSGMESNPYFLFDCFFVINVHVFEVSHATALQSGIGVPH